MGSLVITRVLLVYWLTCCVTASQLSLEYADPHTEESPLPKADAQHDSIDLDSSKSWWDFYPEREPEMVTPSTTNLDLSKPTYQVESRKVAIAEKLNSLKKIYPPANSSRNKVELTESKQIHQRREPGDWRNPETRFINNTSLIPPSSSDRDPSAVVPPPSPIKGTFDKIRANKNGGGYPYSRSREIEKPRITLRTIEPKRPILRGADATITIVPFPSTSNESRGKTEPNENRQVNQRFEPGNWRNPDRRFINNSPVKPPLRQGWGPNAIVPPPSRSKGKFAEIRPHENGGGYSYPRSREMEKPRITIKMIEPKRPISRGSNATITIVPFPSTTNETRGKTKPSGNGHVNQRLEPGDWRNPEKRFINNSSLRPPSSPHSDPNAVVPPPSSTKGKLAEVRPNENGGGYPRSRKMEKPKITLRIIEPRRPISRGADATITIIPFPKRTNITEDGTERYRNGQVYPSPQSGGLKNPNPRPVHSATGIVDPSVSTNGTRRNIEQQSFDIESHRVT